MLTRFAWFYSTNLNSFAGLTYQTALYSKLLLTIFAEYKLIENKQPIIVPELNLWASFGTNYLQNGCKRGLGKIVQSGLYAYQYHYIEFVNQYIYTSSRLFTSNQGSIIVGTGYH